VPDNDQLFVKLPLRTRERLHELTGAELKVFIAYLTHANMEGIAWPARELLCRETGCMTIP